MEILNLNCTSSPSKFRIVIIGLGKQGAQEYLPRALLDSSVTLVGICDPDEAVVNTLSSKYEIQGFTQLESMLDEVSMDMAIVCVPHSQYPKILKMLAKKEIHIFKEKPFACNLLQALKFNKLLSNSKSEMGVAVERQYDPLYQHFKKYIASVGQVYLIEAEYTLNKLELQGWRNNFSMTGGGALLELGYHMIDLLINYFGELSNVKASMCGRGLKNENQGLETTALVQFTVKDANEKIGRGTFGSAIGIAKISLVGHKKSESLRVLGMNGSAYLENGTIYLFDRAGQLLEFQNREILNAVDADKDRVWSQVKNFIEFLRGETSCCPVYYKNQMSHLEVIEAAYTSAIGKYRKVQVKNGGKDEDTLGI